MEKYMIVIFGVQKTHNFTMDAAMQAVNSQVRDPYYSF